MIKTKEQLEAEIKSLVDTHNSLTNAVVKMNADKLKIEGQIATLQERIKNGDFFEAPKAPLQVVTDEKEVAEEETQG